MNSREYRKKRESAKKLYLKGETGVKSLAETFSVSENTIRSWIKKYNWKNEYDEINALDDEIKIALKHALVKALKEYANNPQNTALQSLVSLLRQYKKEIEPSRDLVEHLRKFLDWEVDYFLEKDEEIAKAIQREILEEGGLIDYFKNRASFNN